MDPFKDKPKEDRPPRSGGFNRDDRGGSGGPHFPTTRLMGEDKKDFNR